jgi:hypothetical protein
VRTANEANSGLTSKTMKKQKINKNTKYENNNKNNISSKNQDQQYAKKVLNRIIE